MNKNSFDSLWINALIATAKKGYGLINHAAIGVKEGKIAWLGTMADWEKLGANANNIYDLKGALLTPGFIDCHTHLVYAANRAHEFEMRLQGISYEEIAKRGGGIQSTVIATRKASEEELLQQSLKRAKALMASGVTTIEIKSGYGLDWPTELKLLQVAKKLAEILPVTVVKTFLGAHTFPSEFRSHPEAYVDLICNEMIPTVAKEKYADAVDVFCEKIAFNLEQTERVFKTAKDHGLAIKCHSEQLSDSGSAALSAKYNALSVDHLEHVSPEGVKAIAKSGTVAVLLPGAFYFLRETHLPPIQALRENGVPIAIASDCNPGTSPVASILLMMNMACTLFRLTPEEAFLGVTQNAAKALGLEKTYGSLEVGKVADFAIWDVNHPNELAYYLGMQPLKQLVIKGNVIARRA